MKRPWFAALVTTLDTPGGHMLVCLLVMAMGATFAALKLPKGEDLIVGGFGALAIAMRGRGAENHLPGPADTTHTVSVVEEGHNT